MKRFVDVIVGLQYGDEGKGAEIHRLSKDYQLIARCMGGNNAGHTIVRPDGKALVLHLLPSSVLRKDIDIAIGAGVVIDPVALQCEVVACEAAGLSIWPRLMIDPRAALVLIYHRLTDIFKEQLRSKNSSAIGTTAKGIGPAYADYADRCVVRFGDLTSSRRFKELLEHEVAAKNSWFASLDLPAGSMLEALKKLQENDRRANRELLESNMLFDSVFDYPDLISSDGKTLSVDKVREYYLNQTSTMLMKSGCRIMDISKIVNGCVKMCQPVLVEGAQGASLDLFFGSYPYVTSSHTIAGGACVGLGIGPNTIRSVRGIAKAYLTRVGNGPFRTRMNDEQAAIIRGDGNQIGDEYGATTGRPRDVGWFDAVQVRTAIMHNGVERLTLTKLDKLSGFDEILVCTEYYYGVNVFRCLPHDDPESTSRDPHQMIPCINSDRCNPHYVTLPGWKMDITKCRTASELPKEAQDYVSQIERFLNQGSAWPVKIDRVGVGPTREDVIVLWE